jgi:hypothetical protein
METSTQKAIYFSIQQLALTPNVTVHLHGVLSGVNPLRAILCLLLAGFFLLKPSLLHAQNDTSMIDLYSWDFKSIDSIVNTAHLDSAEVFHFWQSVQDSINEDSILSIFNTADSKMKHLKDSLNIDIQDSSTQELFSGMISTFKNVLLNKSSLGEQSSFGIEIRTNIPVAILSIPNSFFAVEYSNVNSISKGDGQNNVTSTYVSKPISFGFGLKYSLNANIALSLFFDRGMLSGIQDNVNTSLLYNTHDFKSFTNNFKSYGLSLEMNPINAISSTKNVTRFNTWFILGFAYVDNDVKAYRCDGRIKSYNFLCFATTIGVKLSYSLVPSCDLVCGSTLYMLETAYLDGVYIDNKKNDKMLLNYVGINYKLSSASNKKPSFR